MGLDRWDVTRNQLEIPNFRKFCRELIVYYADLIEMHFRQHIKIIIVGAAGSPSCGIFTISNGYFGGLVHECKYAKIPGKGIFTEELLKALECGGVNFQVTKPIKP